MKYISAKLTGVRLLLLGLFLNIPFVWKFFNIKGVQKYHRYYEAKSGKEEEILSELLTEGIVAFNISDISNTTLTDLQKWMESKKNATITGTHKDSFLKYYLGGKYLTEEQFFEVSNPLIDFSLSDKLLGVVNSYFSMFARLIYLECNETIVLEKSDNLTLSQKFHRDPGIRGCLKVFVYLTDVGEGDGAFTYIRNTHTYGKFCNFFKQRFFGVGGVYPDDADIRKIFEPKDIYEVLGDAGTVIIADTTGIHKGGLSVNRAREMTTSVFYPPADYHKSKIKIGPGFDQLKKSHSQFFALTGK